MRFCALVIISSIKKRNHNVRRKRYEKETSKRLLSIGLVSMMTVSLAACGSSGGGSEEESGNGESEGKDVKVGFVISDMSDAFFAHLVQRLEEYSKEIGVTFTATECPEIGDKLQE